MIKYLTLLMMFCSTAAHAAKVTFDADYPGGNILVDRIDGDTVTLQQDLRDNARWWFYWNFRVRAEAGRTLTFRFTNKNVFGTQGPAVSEDGGLTWSWLGTKTVKPNSFSYTFPPDGKSGPPRFPGRAKSKQWSYPYGYEHDGKLYVVYSIGKEDCGLSVIPIESLAAKEAARNDAALGESLIRFSQIWDPSVPMPSSAEASVLTGVMFRINKPHESEVDGYEGSSGPALSGTRRPGVSPGSTTPRASGGDESVVGITTTVLHKVPMHE